MLLLPPQRRIKMPPQLSQTRLMQQMTKKLKQQLTKLLLMLPPPPQRPIKMQPLPLKPKQKPNKMLLMLPLPLPKLSKTLPMPRYQKHKVSLRPLMLPLPRPKLTGKLLMPPPLLPQEHPPLPPLLEPNQLVPLLITIKNHFHSLLLNNRKICSNGTTKPELLHNHLLQILRKCYSISEERMKKSTLYQVKLVSLPMKVKQLSMKPLLL